MSSSSSIDQTRKKRIGWLKSNGAFEEATRLEDCEKHYLIFHNLHTHDVKIVPRHCQSKFCPICGPKIQKELENRISTIISRIDQNALRFITLTQRDFPNESLAHAAARFRESFDKFRRHKSWATNIWGSYVKYEATWNKIRNSWHYHCHILAHGRYIPREELKKNWMSVSPGSFIIDIRRINAKTAKELSKYVTRLKYKGTMPLGDLTYYMKNHRMSTSNGTLRKILANLKDFPKESGYAYLGSVDVFFSDVYFGVYSSITYDVCQHFCQIAKVMSNAPPVYVQRAYDYVDLFRDDYEQELMAPTNLII